MKHYSLIDLTYVLLLDAFEALTGVGKISWFNKRSMIFARDTSNAL